MFMLFLTACSSTAEQDIKAADGFAVLPDPGEGEAVADFAGGCFWAMQEALLQLKGVHLVISGYAGGEAGHPTYQDVLAGNTGHAEAVQVYYDPKVISFDKLATAFFHAHDPTQVNGQGPDLGSDYRSIAFYRNAAENAILRRLIQEVNNSGQHQDEVVTELVNFEAFYPAEMEHQDYYKRNPWDLYIRRVSRPKVLKLQKSMPEWIKPEYLE